MIVKLSLIAGEQKYDYDFFLPRDRWNMSDEMIAFYIKAKFEKKWIYSVEQVSYLSTLCMFGKVCVPCKL